MDLARLSLPAGLALPARLVALGLLGTLAACVPRSLVPFLSRWMLAVLGVSVDPVDDASRKRYRDARDAEEPVILAFHHPTFFDHMVMYAGLGDVPRFLVKPQYTPFPLSLVCRRLGCLFVQPSGTTAALCAAVSSRGSGEAVVAVAPAGGRVDPRTPWNVAPYRTGTFVASPTVLPVVLRYAPYRPWTTGTLPAALLDRLVGPPMRVVLEVLPPVRRHEDETVEAFGERVRKDMSVALRKWTHRPPASQRPSLACCLTACLFLIPAVIAWERSHRAEAIGMAATAVVSLLYHSTGDPHARFVDMLQNGLLGAFFCVRDPRRILGATVAIVGYLSSQRMRGYRHALLVHIPVLVSFLWIALQP